MQEMLDFESQRTRTEHNSAIELVLVSYHAASKKDEAAHES